MDRRQFERLHMTEDAIAMAEDGRELGRVSQAGGGGMMIACTPEVASSLAIGQKLRVTIVEPASQTRNVMDVVVRYKEPRGVGVEFVSGTPAADER